MPGRRFRLSQGAGDTPPRRVEKPWRMPLRLDAVSQVRPLVSWMARGINRSFQVLHSSFADSFSRMAWTVQPFQRRRQPESMTGIHVSGNKGERKRARMLRKMPGSSRRDRSRKAFA